MLSLQSGKEVPIYTLTQISKILEMKKKDMVSINTLMRSRTNFCTFSDGIRRKAIKLTLKMPIRVAPV